MKSRRCLELEIALARELLALAREGSRIGVEPSCQHSYLLLDLVEKVADCRWLLGHFEWGETGHKKPAREVKSQVYRCEIGMKPALIHADEFMMGSSHTAKEGAELFRQDGWDFKPDFFTGGDLP